jgi:uncharacterized protein (DUF2342 family)
LSIDWKSSRKIASGRAEAPPPVTAAREGSTAPAAHSAMTAAIASVSGTSALAWTRAVTWSPKPGRTCASAATRFSTNTRGSLSKRSKDNQAACQPAATSLRKPCASSVDLPEPVGAVTTANLRCCRPTRVPTRSGRSSRRVSVDGG